MPTPDTIVQEIADDRIAAAQTNSAAAQGSVATAQNVIAIAHNTIAAAQAASAAAIAKIAAIDDVPLPDYAVWLNFAVARCQQTNSIASSFPEVAVHADKMLLEYRRRFPILAANPTPPTGVQQLTLALNI